MARKSVAGGSWGRRQGAVVSPSSPPSPAHSSLEWLSLQTSTLWIQGLTDPDLAARAPHPRGCRVGRFLTETESPAHLLTASAGRKVRPRRPSPESLL